MVKNDYVFRHSTDFYEDSLDVKIEGWCKPRKEYLNLTIAKHKLVYDQYCKSLVKQIKQMLYDERQKINSDNEYIVDMDLRTNSVQYGKLSYFSIQMMLSSDVNCEYLMVLINDLLNNCEVMEYQPFKN